MDIASASALVVGGTAGIGHAGAQALLEAGLRRLVISGRSPGRGLAARARLAERFPGAEIHYLQCNAVHAEEADALAEATAERLGSIDILLSSGGGDPMPRLLHQIPTAELMPTISSIVAGIIHPARAVLPHMSRQGGGAVICLASDAAKVATPGETAIGAAMAAIVMFCRGMANEAKRNGIRVNCLTPSIVRGTPLYDTLMADPFCNRLFGKAETMASLGIVEPEDLAAMVVFLASPAAARLTGQTISINGGISAV
ncbi:Oxidoreductase, short-chain dehydrogenase/reductase family [Polymorphum gilvum SL003B-26A1]|uniref:Oxidoreductase, short-chain dehydrogenase/reductase family n=1 Tax=Polymorphum gilvum (strain LMG 25793 / CGMCC 1.9160 / SL003B-26A1) TaxID=991905 RepID=F2IYP8_POLGS|nr:Oxidoreductase, short-chain dehydrogenase/reductase family [Polymorphum gilvum SL003B-26A1]